MKKIFSKKLTKILSACLALVLAIGSVGVSAFGAANEALPTLSLDYANLSFRDSICIKYAVDADGAENVKLLCWTAPQTQYTKGTENRVLNGYEDTISGKKYLVFDYTGLSAKQMTEEIYVRAYAEVNGQAVYSNVRKYSVLEYAYTMLGKVTSYVSPDANLKALLESMLVYGGNAQTYFNYRTDALASEPFYLVKVKGGALLDGTDYSLSPKGAAVSVKAPLVNNAGASFAYWADANGNKVANAAEDTITVTGNATYSPIYVKYSAGLAFESNGDGTCIVLGMGDCTDTELVIPPTSPEGDSVVEIDASAFAGEAITSVSLPATIEAIGRRAFNGCSSLTDVYYDGTEEDWNANVYVNATGNDAFLNATMHFNEPAAATFTVTFVDFDGTVLKTETVKAGESATPPANPEREGYTFKGWDGDYTGVSGDTEITAIYEREISNLRNELYLSYVDNGDKTITLTVSIGGNVHLATLDAEFTLSSDAFTIKSAAKAEGILFDNAAVSHNQAEKTVKISCANSTGNIEEGFDLFTVELSYENAPIDEILTLTVTSIGDYDFNEETYTVTPVQVEISK